MKKFIRSLYLQKRFFTVLFSLTVVFVFSYFFENLFGLTKFLLLLLCFTFLLFDILLLYRNKVGVQATRVVPEKLSNGDDNDIEIRLVNRFQIKTAVKIIDELPIQWQRRDFEINTFLL